MFLINFLKILKHDLFHKLNYLLEQACGLRNSVNSPEPLFLVTTKVEVHKEHPKVSMVNMSLKKLKHHLAGFDVVVKERTTATAITEGVKPSTSASRSQPSSNTKKDKILQTPTSTQKNKHSKLNANSELKCVKCNGCMLFDNHDLCVLDFINNVNARVKSKSVKKIGNVCPLTRITTTTEVPLRKPTALENETPKPVVTLVYSRKPRKSKTNVPVSKSKVLKSVSANKKEPSQSWGSIVFDVPSSSLDECRSSKLFSGTVKFRNDHVEKILGYGDYQIGNVTISRVYYVEGLGHNLFSVGQFCDSNLEVAFRQHTCFIHNVEGVDLLTGS
ncbi:hypothetical protein Tco_0990895 [Tanacetum coccineum]|uniref:Retrovirus-related Pol polyprotein from transposon TNT 1-94-like beta-barrel domain-containing protein n=1 Tax=Tanacetum coccineum TaxID=301880 RepID=A0ABQ5EXS2_9ASTR